MLNLILGCSQCGDYTALHFSDIAIAVGGVLSIYLIYKWRRIFPFNLLWMLLVGIFVYALIGYSKKSIKEWWDKD